LLDQERDAVLAERPEERAKDLLHSFNEFSKHWSDSTKEETDINRRLLLEVTSRYFMDVDRKKAENDIEWADSHKRAAFTVKWLLRFKPIQYKSSHTAVEASLANEEFALFVACAYLEIDLVQLPKTLINHIVMHFRHETFHPEPWACTFFVLEKCREAQLLDSLNKHVEGQA